MIPLGNLIGWEWSHLGSEFQLSFNPMEGKHLPEHFVTANTDEISRALRLAQHAFEHFSGLAGEKRAQFLEQIAQAIETLGDSLLDRCHRETGLPMARLAGERGRTCNQLRLFAQLARSESWRAPVLDLADPERKPLPKPDIRTCFAALGPVLVFSAGNFPLAFSVAGGDTASALAVGCPVIVKGHEGHLGTSALVADCIRQAGLATGMPEGTFQMLQGPGPQVGRSLVLGEPIRAVGFTGSLHAGR
ncbi:MAG: aldehyde dehydrogenase family protein, partial [Acidobacteria bacterium]|nr:aldehyde dehydrogenase family protein [Acidobacteriota bacterium]